MEEKILSAAAKLFAEKGFYATGMRAISAAAKVSIGAIYHHFKNKEEILERIIREEVERRVRFIQEVAKEELPLQDKIQKIVAFHFTRIDERRGAVLLFSREQFDPNPVVHSKLGRLYDELAEYTAGILQEGIKRGEIVVFSPLDAAYILLGMVEAASLRALGNDESTTRFRNNEPQELARSIWLWLHLDREKGRAHA